MIDLLIFLFICFVGIALILTIFFEKWSIALWVWMTTKVQEVLENEQ